MRGTNDSRKLATVPAAAPSTADDELVRTLKAVAEELGAIRTVLEKQQQEKGAK